MKGNYFRILATIAVSTIISQSIFSQQISDNEKTFPLGVVKEIRSEVLNEQRTLNIYLPEGYEKDKTNKFPVVYLLDGSANEDFIHVVGIVQFLNMIEAMPPSIVVGIANIDRKRDFTFPTTIAKDKEDYPTTGSSGKFISFIQTELLTYLEKNYRITDQRTIIGQSLGGLLATEVLLKKPYLFANYIIISPSLWWDNESLLTKIKDSNSVQTIKDKQIYISVGTEGKVMEADAVNLNNLLKAYIPTRNNLIFNPLPNESHLTILHQSVYQAFLRLYPKKGS